MIYFLLNERAGAVKIGFSDDVGKRVASLQTASPDRLTLLGSVAGGQADERRLHVRLSGRRIRREWFRADEDVIGEIRQILRDGGGLPTVREELNRRHGCRYGLRGVVVALDGIDEPYVIRSTKWDRSGELVLRVLRQADVPAPPPPPATSADDRPRLVVTTLADAWKTMLAERSVEVDADSCRLLAPWPVVCRCWEATA